MEVFHSHQGLLRPLFRSSITIGVFDGVHLGHRMLLQKCHELAHEQDGDAVVYTFSPNPAQVLAPNNAPLSLTSDERKTELLADEQMNVCIIEPFTRDFANLEPAQFEKILEEIFAPRSIVVGHDFSYGKNRQGNTETLTRWGETHGIAIHIVPPVQQDNLRISSSEIRNLLKEGRVSDARVPLGRYFDVTSQVVTGEKRGRTIGFPTANLAPTPSMECVQTGIYTVWFQLLDSGKWIPGVASLGTNPTFQTGQDRTLEVYLLDFNQDIYGQFVRVAFVERIRDEKRFDDVAALVKEIENDVAIARKHFEVATKP